MRIPLGRNSPSFIIGVVLLATVVGIYAWRVSRPHARGASDLIVREFVEQAQKEVRTARRAIDRAADKVRSGAAADEVLKAIDTAAADAVKSIEQRAEEAIDRLEQIDNISLKTEQNRRSRIRMRLEEMRQAIAEAKTTAADGVRGHDEERAAN
jgi:hypothetical protein